MTIVIVARILTAPLFFWLFTTSTVKKSPTIYSDPFCDRFLSYVYWAFFIAYVYILLYWIEVCSKAAPALRRIHWLKAGLVLTKVLLTYLMTGIHGNVYFYLSPVISIGRLSIVILLITTSDPFVKPFLHDVDEYVFTLTILLQVLGEISKIITGVTGPIIIKDMMDVSENMLFWIDCWIFYELVFYVLDYLMSRVNDKKTIKIRNFYIGSMIYMLVLSRIRTLRNDGQETACDACKHMLDYTFLEETCILLFYPFLLKMFRDYFTSVDGDK